ncbi:Uncharacterised protein [Burkholderia mallei]|nr:putative polyketide synthase [Burkholderia mallei]KOT04559.1 putative polyketide synthase [Burkholderia mallei]SQA73407.1 Uncharacterised protein [Burkholderia mallei]
MGRRPAGAHAAAARLRRRARRAGVSRRHGGRRPVRAHAADRLSARIARATRDARRVRGARLSGAPRGPARSARAASARARVLARRAAHAGGHARRARRSACRRPVRARTRRARSGRRAAPAGRRDLFAAHRVGAGVGRRRRGYGRPPARRRRAGDPVARRQCRSGVPEPPAGRPVARIHVAALRGARGRRIARRGHALPRFPQARVDADRRLSAAAQRFRLSCRSDPAVSRTARRAHRTADAGLPAARRAQCGVRRARVLRSGAPGPQRGGGAGRLGRAGRAGRRARARRRRARGRRRAAAPRAGRGDARGPGRAGCFHRGRNPPHRGRWRRARLRPRSAADAARARLGRPARTRGGARAAVRRRAAGDVPVPAQHAGAHRRVFRREPARAAAGGMRHRMRDGRRRRCRRTAVVARMPGDGARRRARARAGGAVCAGRHRDRRHRVPAARRARHAGSVLGRAEGGRLRGRRTARRSLDVARGYRSRRAPSRNRSRRLSRRHPVVRRGPVPAVPERSRDDGPAAADSARARLGGDRARRALRGRRRRQPHRRVCRRERIGLPPAARTGGHGRRRACRDRRVDGRDREPDLVYVRSSRPEHPGRYRMLELARRAASGGAGAARRRVRSGARRRRQRDLPSGQHDRVLQGRHAVAAGPLQDARRCRRRLRALGRRGDADAPASRAGRRGRRSHPCGDSRQRLQPRRPDGRVDRAASRPAGGPAARRMGRGARVGRRHRLSRDARHRHAARRSDRGARPGRCVRRARRRGGPRHVRNRLGEEQSRASGGGGRAGRRAQDGARAEAPRGAGDAPFLAAERADQPRAHAVRGRRHASRVAGARRRAPARGREQLRLRRRQRPRGARGISVRSAAARGGG